MYSLQASRLSHPHLRTCIVVTKWTIHRPTHGRLHLQSCLNSFPFIKLNIFFNSKAVSFTIITNVKTLLIFADFVSLDRFWHVMCTLFWHVHVYTVVTNMTMCTLLLTCHVYTVLTCPCVQCDWHIYVYNVTDMSNCPCIRCYWHVNVNTVTDMSNCPCIHSSWHAHVYTLHLVLIVNSTCFTTI